MEKLQLDGLGLIEISSDEIIEMNGLGIISGLVADMVEYFNCKCKEAPPITESPILGSRPTHFM